MSEPSGAVERWQDLTTHLDDPERARAVVQSLDVNAIVMQLAAIGRELNLLSDAVAEQDRKVVAAWSEHRRAYATEYLAASGPVEERKLVAGLAVEDLRLQAETEDQVLRHLKERVRILRDRLEIGRSLNAALKSQFLTEGVGQS